MDAFLGEIRPFAFGWVPLDWALCAGQQMMISQYSALYAVIGANFGGNGKTYFNLPDLMSYAIVGQGQTVTGSNYILGQTYGEASVTLNSTQIPYHNHTFNGAVGGTLQRKNAPDAPDAYYLTNFGTRGNASAGLFSNIPGYVNAEPNVALNSAAVSTFGGNPATTPHENRQPYLSIAYYMCINGYFPPRP